MSNNIQLNQTTSSGAILATNEVAGVHHQKFHLAGAPSTGNTTTSPLAAAATFTGTGEQNDHPEVLASCYSDTAGTLFFDFSVDGAHWRTFPTAGFSVAAGVHEIHKAVKGPRYFRVRFTDGGSGQSEFQLYTYFGMFGNLNSPLNAAIQQDSDATTVRAITEEVAIASGLFTGYSIVNKFGTNADIDTGSVPEDIWEGGGTYTGFPDSTLEAIQVESDSASDSSAGTGARTVRVTGLDTNYNVIQETITLNGTTPVDTVNQYRRAHTATVLTAGSGGVNAGTITFRHTTTTANVFLSMVPGRNQTNCSAYTIPAGHTAYMRKIHAAIRGGSTASLDGFIWTRTFGGVFRSRRPFTVTSSYPLRDEIYGGLVFTEKSDLILRIGSSSAVNVSVNGGYDLILVRN